VIPGDLRAHGLLAGDAGELLPGLVEPDPAQGRDLRGGEGHPRPVERLGGALRHRAPLELGSEVRHRDLVGRQVGASTRDHMHVDEVVSTAQLLPRPIGVERVDVHIIGEVTGGAGAAR